VIYKIKKSIKFKNFLALICVNLHINIMVIGLRISFKKTKTNFKPVHRKIFRGDVLFFENKYMVNHSFKRKRGSE